MKILLPIIISSIALFACSTKSGNANSEFRYDTTKLASGAEYYQCPMDPDEISQKAADCPTCGMPLEKRTKQ